MFISFLYMFQATMCPSSGETTVSMWHLALVTLYGWLTGMQDGMKHSTLHTRWWAHSCLKHVQKRKKHTKKNCAPNLLYLQDYTGMHGQQNIKKRKPLAPIRKQTSIHPAHRPVITFTTQFPLILQFGNCTVSL